MEETYLLTYPSQFGMGSDTDKHLLTGTFDDEVFCDSGDMEEVVNDVIRKRLNACTTYSRDNDLQKVGPLSHKTIVLENQIFVIYNQFGYRRDVIAGRATFHKYQLGEDEYASFEMQRVLENHFFLNSYEDELFSAQGRLERSLESLGKQRRQGDKRLADWIAEDRETIRKLQEEVAWKDDYREHIYNKQREGDEDSWFVWRGEEDLDVEYLFADRVREGNNLATALLNVFGYD